MNENYKLKSVLSMLLFVMSIYGAVAQGKVVTGTVNDSSGDPLPGVTIMVKGTTNGAVTNIDGSYSINNVNSEDVLVFSFVGTVSQEAPVGAKSVLDVTMQDDIVSLEEIVVVGYGTQKKKDVTGSVAVVDKEELAQRPNSQVGALIQGKAAGVQVLSSSGKPSQGLNIRIRGTNSINAGSDPLYVVDGVPTTDTRSINPADIESVSILKDAASGAIYGAQAANGVVIITTKGGSGKPMVTFNSYGGYSEVWKTIPVLEARDYRDLMIEMGQNTDWNQYNENTNWQDEIFQKGVSQNYQLAFSGSNENANYYVSGGWTAQEGAVRSSKMDRASFKINLDQQIYDWLKLGTRLAYTKYSDVDVTDNQNVNSGGVLLGALSTPSIIGIYNPDGTFTSNPFQNWENPVASTDGSDREFNNTRILANAYLEFSFLKNFKFKTNLGIDNSNGIYDYFLDPFGTSYGRALSGRGINNTNNSSYRIFDNTLNYNKTIGKHAIEALGGVISQYWLWENSAITTENFSGDGIKTVNAGSLITHAEATKTEKSNLSYIGRLNYSFDDKYLVSANFRADGSSVFGPKNRWGYFSAFSLGWRISEESFLRDVKFLSDLKLRAGAGVVGNDQIENYAYLGRVGGGANYPIGGIAQPGTYPASIQNETLKWEESRQLNVGLDVSLFNNRISLAADAYVKNTADLLLNAPLPRTTGFDNALQNIGEIQNKGLEFNLNTVNLDSEVSWRTNLNVSFNRNEVLDIVGQEIFLGSIPGRGEASLVREGLPMGTLYGYNYGGVDPATGNAFYIAQDGESTFTPAPEDRVIIGDANPDFIYGFTNTVSYKGISLLVFLQGSQGNDILNATRIETEGMTDPKNQTSAVLNRWQAPGDVTDIPRSSWGNTDNSRISTRFIEDASYMRIKTISIGYDFPSKWLSKAKIQGLKVYVTGENLWTFTNYSGFDPEVNAFGASNTARGIDYGTYPQTRNLIFGLNLTF